MFERTEEEICNIGRDGLVDKTDPRLKILLEERRKNGRARGEIYMLRKDGTKFNVEVSSVIFLDIEGGEKTSMVIQDLTERKKIEKELNESKQLFQNLAEFSPFGIFQNNHEGQTTYVNPKWVELSGLSYSEAMGTGWLSAIHPDDKEKLVSDWQKGLQNHVETLSEYRFLKPDGTEVWVLGKAVPYFSNNTFAGFIGTIVDITDRKKFEEELISLKENLQDQVNEQTKVLKSKIKELENFREATINREFRMAELKDEIKRLKDEKNGIDD
jgi:PAS domain S-box-containing protein